MYERNMYQMHRELGYGRLESAWSAACYIATGLAALIRKKPRE